MLTHFALAIALVALPAAASAGDLSLAVSAGSGYRTDPSGRIATNLMVAPGFDLLGDFVRLEAGFVADLPDVARSELDLQLRPMAVINLPLVPLYARLVTGVTQLVHGPVAFAFGGALGIDAAASKTTAVFAEAGFVPRAREGHFDSIFEGRLGLRFD